MYFNDAEDEGGSMRAKHTIFKTKQTKHKNKSGGRSYIYLPVPNEQLSGDAEIFNENRVKRNEGVYTIIRHDGRAKPLLFVKPKDRLYVFGHGNLGQGIGLHGQGLDPEALAKRLQSDGLRKSTKYIKLLACNTGRIMPDYEKSFAQRVANELGALKYNNIVVIGYLGFVTITGSMVEGKYIESHLKGNGHTEDLPKEFLYPPPDGDDVEVRSGKAKMHREYFKPETG
ncbi:MAG: hypothetical protein ACR2RA_23675 [Geminicoccaceae bacterium]